MAAFQKDWIALGFVPYLVAYLAASALRLPAQGVLVAFWLLHLLWVVKLGRRCLSRLVSGELSADLREEGWLWPLIFLACWLPGAYLEYPSDAWEHFRRIFAWPEFSHIRENVLWPRFAYFWDWSLVFWVKPAQRRAAVDLLSAFWQTLLGYQFYRMMLAFGMSRAWARVQLLGYFLLFGNTLFGFRYYALASTMLAQTSLWGAITYVLQHFTLGGHHWVFNGRWWMAGSVLGGLALLMAFDHPQTLLFLGTSGAAFACAPIVTRFFDRPESRKPILGVLAVLAVVGVVFGAIGRTQFPNSYPGIPWAYLSHMGALKIWKPQIKFISCWGLAGLLGLACAVALIRKRPWMSLLALMPPFLVVWGPSNFVLCQFFQGIGAAYRILYAFPAAVLLIEAVRTRWERGALWTAAGVFALAIVPTAPFHGRLQFQFHRAPPELELKFLDPLAEDVLTDGTVARARARGNCKIWTDNTTSVFLQAQFGYFSGGERLAPTFMHQPKFEPSVRLPEELAKQGYCGVLLADPTRVPAAPPSWVSQVSRHWPQEFQEMGLYLLPIQVQEQWKARLKADGWVEKGLRPFYSYLESPTARDLK